MHLFCCFGRKAEVDALKEMVGFLRGIKNLSTHVGSLFGFAVICFAFEFPWLKDICGYSRLKRTAIFFIPARALIVLS